MSTMSAIAQLQAAFATPASGVNTSEIVAAELTIREWSQTTPLLRRKLVEIKKDMWGIEEPAFNKLWQQLREQEDTIKSLGKGDYATATLQRLRDLRTLSELSSKYPRLGIRDVPWCVGDEFNLIPYPRHLNSVSLFSLWQGSTRGAFGNSEQTFRLCHPALKTHANCTLSRDERVSFEGFIPKEAKQKCLAAEKDHFSGEGACTFMIVDYRTLTKVEHDPDPLIVGWHPDAPADLWLVVAFDLTPAEAVIAEAARQAHQELKGG